MNGGAISLLDLTTRIGAAVAADSGLRDVWVTADTGDVRASGGHCYLELIQKDDSGRPVARLRAIIWASQYARLDAEFAAATGSRLVSDLNVMVRLTVNFHPSFGMSGVISAINPEYTCGDLIRRRRMMIERLTDEGIIDMNRTLSWPDVALRVAVVSARGAAGYGDFITHLYSNPFRLRFTTRLFPAVMQGENTPSSIIAALDEIAAAEDEYDCVVIIRGGGATGDLASFDNYDLAANVAQFPLPVIVGIGHERDVTILDYVAAVRVKTPTAAAEWLIDRGAAALGRVRDLASDIFREVTARISGAQRQLAYIEGLLPTLVMGKTARAATYLDEVVLQTVAMNVNRLIENHRQRLNSVADMLAALSPQAVLRRGYAICRRDGYAVTDASALSPGDGLTITFADGLAHTTVDSVENSPVKQK